MSLPIKIKNEPLDPGYGDEIPKPFVVKSEADDDNIDEDIGNLLDMVPLFDDEINERNKTSIRVKTEPVDSPSPVSMSIIKKEPVDLPDDFFDCLNDQNFLEAIADEDDDDDNNAQNKSDGNEMKVNTSEIETELEDKTSKRSEDEDDEGNDDKNELSREAVLTKEIEKLKRKIQKRTHKLGLKTETLLSKESLKANDECSQSSTSSSSHKLEKTEKQDDKYRKGRDYDRSRSGSRSPSSRKGRYRKRMRSRSRSRSRTRSRSRSRSTSYSRSRKNRRSRSRSPNNKPKRPSFLEEIAETFARKGIPFPEKEKLEEMNKNASQDQVKSSELNALKSSSFELNALKSSSFELNALKSLSPSSSNTHHKVMNSYNENKQMNDDGNAEEEFPLPIKIKSEPIDDDDNDTTNIYTNNNQENNREQTEKENIPAPMIIKPEPMDYDEDYNSEKATEEETPFARRLRVLNSCSEAIKNLHNRDVKKSNYKFLHTPSVFKSSNDDENFNENRSILNCPKNVMFSFNSTTSNINLKMYGLEKLSENASKVAEIIGFDVKSIKERLNQKDLPYSLKVLRKKSKNDESNNEQNDEDKKTNRYRPFYSNMGTQTEPYSCSACIIRQLRKYKDTGVQVQPIAENQCSSQAHLQTGSPVQQQQQQSYYMSSGNHQQQQQMSPVQSAPMMYNNYGQPMANSYPSYQYQQMTGYGPQPMMNMNGNMMPMQNMPVYPQQQQQPAMGMMPQPVPPPSQHQQHYPPNIRSHPGPRTLPSSNTRRNNYTIPRTSPPSKR